jgi:aspartate carbamoyltransferase regulatory subunit
MKAIKTDSVPVGNEEKGEIIHFQSNCPNCNQSNEDVNHRLTTVCEDRPINVKCKYCNYCYSIHQII